MQGFGLHVIKNPAGSFSFVGTIPRELGNEVPATTNDVLGCRAYRNEANKLVVTKFPVFPTRESAVLHAEKHGYEVEIN
jgi:hypothetical protein